jgi:hypothetical protein
VHGIRAFGTAWNHAIACIFLRIDSIQGSRLDSIPCFAWIPYARRASDAIHAYRRDYIESYVEVLDFQGLFVFLWMKTNILHHCTFSRPYGLEGATLLKSLENNFVL